MKKVILFSCLTASSSFILGQTNTFPATGNTGIGTMSPVTQLHLLNNSTSLSNSNFITIDNRGNNTAYTTSHVIGGLLFAGYRDVRNPANVAGVWSVRTSLVSGWASAGDLVFGATDNYGTNISSDNVLPTERMRILANGNVGIGTSSPLTKLDVRGNVNIGNTKIISLSPDFAGNGELPSGAYLGSNGTNALSFAPSTDLGSAGAKIVFCYYSAGWHSAIEFANVASGYSNLLLMKSGGNVGIGTTTPNPNASLDVNGNVYSNGKIFIGTPNANTATQIAPYSLAVNGSAIFTKAVVKLNSAWPDYVFAPAYNLPKLDSLEQFIKLNQHLPEMPKASDVEKNGIDLGDNQTILLKKIEELTLFAIEQKKQTEKLQKIVEEQNKRITELEINSKKIFKSNSL
ncbi:MAG TPA: hypothetical protein VFI29_14950 [Hanamia sp.]|nr:hypothetical protein [Hanamia sp.]